MNLKFSVCIVLILYSNESMAFDKDKVYHINDKVFSCSGWLSTIIYGFCNNQYKIVKRDTSLMIECSQTGRCGGKRSRISVEVLKNANVPDCGRPRFIVILGAGTMVCIVLILYSNESMAFDKDKVYHINDKVFSCSGWLSTIIYGFCNNQYKIVKRDTSLMIEKMAPKDLQKETSRTRLVDEGHWRRFRRQVASECCLRPCTVADIIMYCPDDAKLLEEHPDIFD